VKPSKVPVIGSGTASGQAGCHSERSEEYRGGGVPTLRDLTPPTPETLRCAQGDMEDAQGDKERLRVKEGH